MKRQFDVTIIGDNLQAALLAQETVAKGLSVAYIIDESENTAVNNERFVVFKYINCIKLLKRIRQNKILNYLKTSVPHLLLITEIEEHAKISIFDMALLHFNNLFSKNRVKVSKLKNSNKLYQLNYSSFKISINRLRQVILKSIDKTKFETIRTGKPLEIKENLGKIIDTREKSSSKIFTSYFTCHNSQIKLEKTISFKTKEISIKIIPWFEWVYFEINSGRIPETKEETILLIKKHFPEIGINEENVLLYKINLQNEIMKADENMTVNNKFHYAFSKVSFHKSHGSLIGSSMGIPYHPLRIMEYCDEKYDEAKHILQNPQYFKKLFYRYGTEIDKVTYQAYEFWNQTKDIKKTWLISELWYVLNHEQCTSAEEFIHKHTEEWMSGKETDKELIKTLFKELTSKP